MTYYLDSNPTIISAVAKEKIYKGNWCKVDKDGFLTTTYLEDVEINDESLSFLGIVVGSNDNYEAGQCVPVLTKGTYDTILIGVLKADSGESVCVCGDGILTTVKNARTQNKKYKVVGYVNKLVREDGFLGNTHRITIV